MSRSLPSPAEAARPRPMRRRLRQFSTLMLILLAIELWDEFLYGSRDVALPLIQQDLHLDYAQIGILLGLPTLFAVIIEPIFGILSNMGKRKFLVVWGGFMLSAALIGMALSRTFLPFLMLDMFTAPAGGAFVALAQAALMDGDPSRHEQNMARWTLAGSIGWVTGSLGLSAAVGLGVGWRGLHIAIGIAAAVLSFLAMRQRFPAVRHDEDGEANHMTFRESIRDVMGAARDLNILRWHLLIVFANLMLDVLFGFLALYLVDAGGMDVGMAAIGVAIWTGVGLIGDVLLIPLLERVRGLDYLRVSIVIIAILFPLFLIVPSTAGKFILLGAMGFFNAGWYSILQAQLYTALHGRSGTEMILGAAFSLLDGVIPLALGLVANTFGIGTAMWLLMLGPITLMLGLPRRSRRQETESGA